MADNKSKDDDNIEYITIPIQKGLDPATKEELIRQLAPRAEGIVGNYADVQRAGAAAVLDGAKSFAQSVETPPGVTDETIAQTKAVNAAVDKALDQ